MQRAWKKGVKNPNSIHRKPVSSLQKKKKKKKREKHNQSQTLINFRLSILLNANAIPLTYKSITEK
jgi:hypothetical protein